MEATIIEKNNNNRTHTIKANYVQPFNNYKTRNHDKLFFSVTQGITSSKGQFQILTDFRYPKKMKFLLLSILVLFLCLCNAQKSVRVCYYTNWAQYRPAGGRFTIDNVDPNVCTHIIFAFTKLNNITFEMETVEWNDGPMYKSVSEISLFKQLDP